MGRKRFGKRKHFLFYLACCIVLLTTAGCRSLPIRWLGDYQFAKTDRLLSDGKYEAAFRESEAILQKYPDAFGGRALFYMGLIKIHPENPSANHNEALACFEQILNAFPGSAEAIEARIWALSIRDTVKQINLLELTLKAKDERLEFLSAANKKEIRVLKDKVQRLEDDLEHLTGQMEMMKRIDLGIEEKKRGTQR